MLSSGQRLGRYRIERVLGVGGMSVVYLARHIQLESLHALKVLKTADTEGDRRLLAEGRAQSNLAHPNLVPVTDIIHADGVLALIMAYVSGPTLQQLLAAGPLTLPQADRLVRGILKGVAAAHGVGLVHRDLKPGNILLTAADGEVRPLVTDFGLVKPAAELSTSPGALLGTPAYMSPEQASGLDDIDTRSDVFSLGSVLYEIVYGARAFAARDHEELLSAVVEARYRRPETAAAVPERMNGAIAAALQLDRASRPADAAELLQLWQQGHPDPLSDPSHPEAVVLVERTMALTRALPEPAREAGASETPESLAATIELERVPVHLHAERDAFVGRTREGAALAHALAQGVRLVTVLGAGGVGKTRLLVHYSWSHLENWPGGVYFCDLAETRSLDAVLSAVASAFEVPLLQGEPVVQLGHVIAGRGRCLVILDNAEQVREAAADALGCWLGRSTEAAFVVTSRELLSVPGERLLPLEPLPGADATELFCARAVAVDPTFSPSHEERAVIDKLVGLLDGLPLAIELAAARIRTLSPAKQLSYLGERFRLLAGKGRARRHATLRATLDWSWDLLSDGERAGLCQLSVFEGGLTMEAAEAVLEAGDLWPADVVQGLVDKSLLRKTHADRFGLLVSVKEYAAEKLADRATAEERHGAYYARYGTDEALAELNTARYGQRRAALAQELDNLVTACQRALARADGPVAAATALAAWEVIELQGPFLLGATLLEEAAAHTKERRGGLLWRASRARHLVGQTKQAEAHCASALQLARETGQPIDGTGLQHLGGLYTHQGRAEEARVHLDAALEVYRASGDRRSEGNVLINLGILHVRQSRSAEARACLEQALAIHRETQDRRLEGLSLGNLGLLCSSEGRMDEARSYYEAALDIHREVGDRYAEGQLRGNLGVLYYHLGRRDEALAHYQAALRMHHETGNRACEAALLLSIGNLHLVQHRYRDARAHYEQSVAINRELGDRLLESMGLNSLAIFHFQHGQMEQALGCYERALLLDRELHNRGSEGNVLLNLGILHQRVGRPQQARSCYEAALVALREANHRNLEGVTLACLGELEHDQGKLAQARAWAEAAWPILREVGNRVMESNLLGLLGNIERDSHNLDQAREHYTLSMNLASEVKERSVESAALSGLGSLHARSGKLAEARRLFDRGEALVRGVDDAVALGLLLAERVACRVDDLEAAKAKLHEARQIAEQHQVGESSAFGRALAQAKAALQAPREDVL